MSNNWLSRTEILLGSPAMELLANAKIAVLGLGGVGGATVEALCRAGIAHILLIDYDIIDETNLNRQLLATRDSIGLPKTQAAFLRLKSINPNGDFIISNNFYLPENSSFLYDWNPDFIIDAIDNVTAKLHLIEESHLRQIPMITCLGTGNRLDPSLLRIGDIKDTANGSGCGLARIIRHQLHKLNISNVPVLYSLEPPLKVIASSQNGHHSPGSISFVPSTAGFLLASSTIRFLLDKSL